MSRLSYKSLILILLFLLIPIVLFLRISQRTSPATAGWWDETWMYRQAINISSHTSDETNVYITASIGLGSTDKAQTDAGDFRFLNSTGQILPYYIVSGAGTTSITFHINLDSFPAGAQTLYAYYGNPSATNGFSASDFATEATNYTLGSLGDEEIGGGPIAYWKFDEGVGTTSYESVNNFNGGLINGASWQNEDQCFSGKCVLYDGTDDYISVPNNSQLKFLGSNYTVGVWAKPVSKKNHVFVAKGQGTRRKGYQILTNSTNVLFLYSDTYDSGDHLLTGPTYNTNEWMHLTLVVNKNLNQIEGFVNGNSVGTMDISTISENVSENYSLEIGRNNAYYANSFIDEVKIYPYARTESQIKADYAAGLAGMSSSSDSSVNIGGASSGKSLSDGLVGYWKFDEGVGTTSADSSGNNNLVTFATGDSAPSWVSGKYGIGTSFDGIGKYLSDTNSTTLQMGLSDWSIGLWIKTTQSSGTQIILDKRNSGPSLRYEIKLIDGKPDALLLSTTSVKANITGNTDISDNQWHHIVATYKRSSNLTIYVDGKNDGTVSIIDMKDISILATNPLRFGTSSYNPSSPDNSTFFNGSLDEVRIYNRALSPTEVKQLYEYAPGPVGYWKMDEGSGTTLQDSSGNQNNITTFYGSPSWVTGKTGKAIKFNGTTDRVESSNNLVNLDQNWTISFWATNHNIYKSYNGAISKNDAGDYQSKGVRFSTISSPQDFRLHISDGANYNRCRSYLPAQFNWTYFTGIRNGNTVSLYINGTLTESIDISGYSSIHSSQPWSFGKGNDGYFNGSLDEVRIYNYARTQKQILEDMQATTPVGATTKVSQPIAWYKFDEGFGSTTANWGIGGTSLNGTFGTGTSSPSWANGKVNKGLSFDGNDYVNIPDNTAFDLQQNFSVSGWFKTSATGVRTGIFYLPAGGYISVFVHSTNTFYFETRDSNNAYLGVSSGSYHDGQWHHFVATRDDNDDKLSIFIDGLFVSSVGDTRTGNFNSTSGPYIGRDSSDFKFNGLIDEVKIYNYALSAEEVKQDYNQGSSTVFGTTSQTIGATTTSLEYCVPGSTDYCAPPVGEWKFDEGVGTTTYDTSSNNYSGIFGTGTSSPSWSIGKFGKSLSFNSSQNQYVDLGNQKLVITGDVTVNAWIKTNSSGTNRAIIAKYGNSGAYTWRLAMNTTGNIIFNRGESGTEAYNTVVTSNKIVNDNQWHFVTATFDSNYMKLYIDGQFDNQVVETRASNGLTTWEACIGDDGYTCGLAYAYSYWQGSIDQVRVYNYARTPAQIAYDYNKGEPVGWWKMDECQGTLINDWSGNSNHGTLSVGGSGTQTTAGTCTTTGAWAAGAIGKSNSSLNFDGTDDYVSLSDTSAFSFSNTNQFSYSFWIKPNFLSTNAIISKQSNISPYTGYSIWLNSGKIRFEMAGSSQFTADTTTTITTNQWQHVTVTYDGSNQPSGVNTYINGIKQTITTSGTIPSNITNNISFQINGRNGPNRTLNTKLDDVRIYNYALTATQVKTLYNNGSVNFR